MNILGEIKTKFLSKDKKVIDKINSNSRNTERFRNFIFILVAIVITLGLVDIFYFQKHKPIHMVVAVPYYDNTNKVNGFITADSDVSANKNTVVVKLVEEAKVIDGSQVILEANSTKELFIMQKEEFLNKKLNNPTNLIRFSSQQF
jgi:hypothetical protein